MDLFEIDSLVPNQSISPNDAMFDRNHPAYYYKAGKSALNCIRLSLSAANKASISSILDLPCGHGRVLRYLQAEFPQAKITACDLDQDAVDFCAKTFECRGIYSQRNLSKLALDE